MRGVPTRITAAGVDMRYAALNNRETFMSASSKRASRALLSIAVAWACVEPTHAALFFRNYEIDLTELTYESSDGITTVAYIQSPVDPFVFGAVGDQLITAVTFEGNQRLQLWSGTFEMVFIQYLTFAGETAQGSKSLQVTRLLGVTGDYDGLPLYIYDQQFICGNCLQHSRSATI